LKIFWAFLAVLIVVPVLAVAGLLVGLNTGYGRGLAVGEINRFAGPQIQIAGLGGHFPADLKISRVIVSDSRGVYATGTDLEVRWRPLELLSRRVDVTDLTAGAVTVERAPVAGKTGGGGGGGLPAFQLDVAHVAVGALHVGAALAGRDVTLAVDGHLRLNNLMRGDVALDAAAAGGRGTYHVVALIDPDLVDVDAKIDEPADGLIGHFAGPAVHEPLHVVMTLAGPRDHAKLGFAARLGAAVLDGAGFVGLDPAAPRADVVVTVPSLAAAAALAGRKLAGSTRLHVIGAGAKDAAAISVDGDVDLSAGPGPCAALVGPDGKLAAVVTLAHDQVTVRAFSASGAGFAVTAHGILSRQGVDMDAHVAVKNIALLSPGIAGPVSVNGHVVGTAGDFAVDGRVTGDISESRIPSGPFALVVNVAHLPAAPEGTVSGSGDLENSPLKLDAKFARDAAGVISAAISQSSWRSLSASGNVSIRPGASLPFGQAQFSIGSLADLAAFLPGKISGRVDGDFSHQDAQNFALHVNAKNVVAVPQVGAMNGRFSASGPETALAIILQGSVAKILNAPARVTLAGVLNVVARTASVTGLTASWRDVNAKLLGPATVATEPGIAVRHAVLAVNGGTISFDGSVTPKMNFSVSAHEIPASLIALAAPVKAGGTIDMTAALSGTPHNPAGTMTLNARHVRVSEGVAESLPPADFAAELQIAGKTVNVSATLGLGPAVNLAADGLVPLTQTGPLSLHLTGTTDLRLLDPIMASAGTTVRGTVTPDVIVTGSAASPVVNGTVTLAGGSVQDLSSGLNLTQMSGRLAGAGRLVTLQDFQAHAGAGTIAGHGTIDLAQADWPIDLALSADNATPVSSDLATESANAALTLKGDARGAMALTGTIDLLRANINIPKSLPPDVANLPILNEGQKPPPPPPPPPDVALDLTIRAKNQIFIRGDGLFAELGGTVHLSGTAKNPDPEGGFTLIRGTFALPGKTLEFTQGTVNFTGDGFVPTLDLEASTTTATNATATLVVGGTAEKPTITLSASPPLPSDEVLSELLFGEATTSLSPFQAASLAAALASLSGVGGSAVSDPLGGVRSALGLDELSLGGNGSGAPTVNAGRYVAPGVYVGAQQSATGQGTQATVQINLLKGLQLQTSTGTSTAGAGNSSSVGLTYQFNY
jgi:translocation and assembly module TamB